MSTHKQTVRQEVTKQITIGGTWLGTARTWIQSNIPNGDTKLWSSTELVKVPFNKLQELAKDVAIQAVITDRIDAQHNPKELTPVELNILLSKAAEDNPALYMSHVTNSMISNYT